MVLVAHDVQKGLLLPREGRVRQILRRRRAAHREGELLVAARDALPLGLGVFTPRDGVNQGGIQRLTNLIPNKMKMDHFFGAEPYSTINHL